MYNGFKNFETAICCSYFEQEYSVELENIKKKYTNSTLVGDDLARLKDKILIELYNFIYAEIGLILPELTNYFFDSLLRGAITEIDFLEVAKHILED